ncbi:MAG: dTDP-4-dehydrorhamnose reductase [Anaerolineae bacterium]|nr:dTDP-4-dehydrorhamnose reductase [Anaerolineae bacterium]
MHILITGARGRLGGKLAALLSTDHTITSVDLPETDISDPAAVSEIAAARPDLVIHCAAWTDVDGCAREPERALRINAYGTKHVALACQQVGAPLVHISTNEVFDGTATTPYREYDPTRPANPYGYSKWAAEQIVRELLPRHYIVRPSWIIAHGGRNFVQTILERARAGQRLRVVTNEIAAPTYNDDLAGAIIRLLGTGHFGTYHLTNTGEISRWGLARFVLDHTGFAHVPIEPIVLAQYPRPSTPPEYGVLANSAAALLGITLRPWQEAVRAFLRTEGVLVMEDSGR